MLNRLIKIRTANSGNVQWIGMLFQMNREDARLQYEIERVFMIEEVKIKFR